MTIYIITGLIIGILTSIYVCVDGLVEGADDLDIIIRMIVMCLFMAAFWPVLLIYLPLLVMYMVYRYITCT